MGFMFNGTQANVTLSGSIGCPTPTSDQSIILVTHLGTGAVTDLYTVPANKRFLLMWYAADLNGAGSFTIRDPTDTYLVGGNIAAGNPYVTQSFSTPLWVYAAGEKVRGNITLNRSLMFGGILEDV